MLSDHLYSMYNIYMYMYHIILSYCVYWVIPSSFASTDPPFSSRYSTISFLPNPSGEKRIPFTSVLFYMSLRSPEAKWRGVDFLPEASLMFTLSGVTRDLITSMLPLLHASNIASAILYKGCTPFYKVSSPNQPG